MSARGHVERLYSQDGGKFELPPGPPQDRLHKIFVIHRLVASLQRFRVGS